MSAKARQSYSSGVTGTATFVHDLKHSTPEEAASAVAASVKAELERHREAMDDIVMSALAAAELRSEKR